MTAKLRGAGGTITFLSAYYAPTADIKEKEKDAFCDDLAAATEEEKGSFIYIGGTSTLDFMRGNRMSKKKLENT